MTCFTQRRRVVVTGLGMVSPVGNTVLEAWASVVAGRSGIAAITRFDASALTTRFAGEFKNFNVDAYIAAKDARHMDRFIHYGHGSCHPGNAGCRARHGRRAARRAGGTHSTLIGSCIGGLPAIEETHREYQERGARRISPFFVRTSIINMVSGHMSIRFGFTDPTWPLQPPALQDCTALARPAG